MSPAPSEYSNMYLIMFGNRLNKGVTLNKREGAG